MKFQVSARGTENLLKLLPPGSSNHPLNRQAIVTSKLIPNAAGQGYSIGRVKFLGTSWPARCERPILIALGAPVYVLARENSTLIVELITISAPKQSESIDLTTATL